MTERDQNLQDFLERSIRAGTAPAVVAMWGRAGAKVSSKVLGYSTLVPERAEISLDTWFDLASLTKPLVTTTLSLLAFRSGVMSPGTRVGEVLDKFRGTDVGFLEVQQLLTHTGGLPAWLPLYCLAEGRPDLLESRLAKIVLERGPNRAVVYSCVGFVLLGLMLARIADEELDSLFQGEVLEKVGLEGELGFNPDLATHSLSSGADQPATEMRLVRDLGFDQRWIPAPASGSPDDGNARFLGGVAGNAGLFGTARGVLALASEYLPGGGSLLSSAEAATATAFHTEGLEQGRGWGWQLASSPGCSAGQALSAGAFGHTGFTGVSVWCDPKTEICYGLLTNRNHPAQRENDLHSLRRTFHRLAAGTVAQ